MAAPIWISLPILASLSLLGPCSSQRHLGSIQAQKGPSLGQAHHTIFNKMYQPVLSGVYNCDDDGNCVLIDSSCNPGNAVPNYPPMLPPCTGDYGSIDNSGGRSEPIGPGGDGGLLPGSPVGLKKVQNGVGRMDNYNEPIKTSEMGELVTALEDVSDAVMALASKASHNQLVLPPPGDGDRYGGNTGEGDRVKPNTAAEAPVSG